MIAGIVAEYNPFHNGHLKQIEYIKERLPDTVIVSVMSGNVVQRGELAVYDKYTRAEMALRCGVDAVLELPYPWCGASAGYFAKGGVEIAKAIGKNEDIPAFEEKIAELKKAINRFYFNDFDRDDCGHYTLRKWAGRMLQRVPSIGDEFVYKRLNIKVNKVFFVIYWLRNASCRNFYKFFRGGAADGTNEVLGEFFTCNGKHTVVAGILFHKRVYQKSCQKSTLIY